ncbi:DNA-binding domain-containing protein [Primorskyibacter aestuariivivens]|uniref:HvfC/BufC N-terminal domain-containing protein n=1 Tax=Primorskyibacter aestuariivivens TaxID=1888912 RepID=UPI002300E34D|nr:DNA-binding domain-containing protein [Primorskyibacter aestuariivivens]MDA7427416.1 DNA-binding domain-containing protein [Primorskyibacter aestuariivivens]
MTRQTEFRTALLDAAQPQPEGLSDGKGRPAGRRYNVYRNNVAVSLSEALETGFPAVAKLIGAENFRNIAGLYLRQSPPESPRMMLYGRGFGEFLDGFAPLAKYPYLGDVARLEFGLRESYHAADSTPIDPAALGIDPERLMASMLTLAPSLRILRSPFPVVSLWRYNMEPGAPKPTAEPQDALILRAEFDPEPHLLPPGGAQFIEALLCGETLGAAYEAGLARTDAFDLSAMLTLLLGGNAITSLEEPTP